MGKYVDYYMVLESTKLDIKIYFSSAPRTRTLRETPTSELKQQHLPSGDRRMKDTRKLAAYFRDLHIDRICPIRRLSCLESEHQLPRLVRTDAAGLSYLSRAWERKRKSPRHQSGRSQICHLTQRWKTLRNKGYRRNEVCPSHWNGSPFILKPKIVQFGQHSSFETSGSHELIG
jgi:hypothetical protein